jgi:hypothetical protein
MRSRERLKPTGVQLATSSATGRLCRCGHEDPGVALDLAIPRRRLWPQESGACVKYTTADADLFA